MKKQSFRYLVVASALALLMCSTSIGADNLFTKEELLNMKAAADAPQSKQVIAVTREFVGPMDKIGQYLDQVMQEIADQGLDGTLVGYRSEPVIFLEADPLDGPATMRIGLTYPGYVQTSGNLSVSEFSSPQSVSYTVTGSYDELCPAYYEIADGVAANGQKAGFPVIMMPVDDPRYIDAKSLRTELIIPVSGAVSDVAVSGRTPRTPTTGSR